MTNTADIVSFGSPVLDFLEEGDKEELLKDIRVIARYPNSSPFRSGRLIGEKILFNKPALIEAERGEGRIIVFGFRPQNRAQTHGTFMLFFNSLYYGTTPTK